MEVEIHDAQAGRIGNDLPAVHKARPQLFLLVLVEAGSLVLHHVVESRKKKAPGPTGRVADGVVDRGLHHIDNRLDELAGGEVLAGPLGRLLGALGEQALVDVPLHVGIHARPLLAVN